MSEINIDPERPSHSDLISALKTGVESIRTKLSEKWKDVPDEVFVGRGTAIVGAILAGIGVATHNQVIEVSGIVAATRGYIMDLNADPDDNWEKSNTLTFTQKEIEDILRKQKKPVVSKPK